MKMYQKGLGIAVVLCLALLLVVPAQAQTAMSVEAADQIGLDGTVTVSRVVTDQPGFLVIHADDGSGAPGEAIGHVTLGSGENLDIHVPVDYSKATSTLFAVIHTDDNTIGTYEFGTVEGADAPVMVNDQPVAMSFHLNTLLVPDQIVKDQVNVAEVIVQQPSWVVIHAGDADGFADPIGQAFVDAGVTTNLAVKIDPTKRTDILWPMVHTDTGTANTFEFGTVDMTDLPLTMNDTAATLPIVTTPSIRTGAEQIILGSNGLVIGNNANVVIESVLSDGPGFIAIHNDVNGAMGDVIGFTSVPDGLSTNVKVNVDPTLVTPTVWPVLHTDDGTVGTFEFGTTDGADLPVMVNEQPIASALPVAPFLQFAQQQTLDNDQIMVTEALVTSPGFVVVQADDGKGQPGAVLAQVPVNAGLNQNIAAALNTAELTNPLYITLHQDANQIGVFESGDAPVLLNNEPLTGVLTLTGDTAPAFTKLNFVFPCIVTLGDTAQVNERSGPGTNFDIVTLLSGGETLTFTDQTQDADGFTWWQTGDGNWVRSDVTGAVEDCQTTSP